MQELLLVNPSPRLSNPRGRRRRRRGASAKQIAWRRKFAAMYGGGRRKRRSNPAKKRRRARFGKTMRSVKSRSGGSISRAAWRASGYRRNPRRRRRNPIGFGAIRFPSMGGLQRTVTEAAQGAIGATLVDVVMGQLAVRNWLPAFSYTDMGYPLTKGALAIGVAAVAEAVVPRPFKGIAAEMAKGSITITLAGVIRGFMPATLPMGARRFGYGSSGMIPSGRPRIGEYLSASPGSMSMREMDSYGPGYVASSLGRTGEYMGEYLSR